MRLSTIVRGQTYRFADLRDLLAKANEEKSGDQLAEIGAESETQRVAAKRVLADVTLQDILDNPLIDPDTDDVSRLILSQLDRDAFRSAAALTVGELRELLLNSATGEDAILSLRRALTPEMVAAATKLMTNMDLVVGAAKIRNVTKCRNTLGERGTLGIRLQPNHPTDDLQGIILSTLDGLLFGCGDAVIGVNPAAESVPMVRDILRALDALIETLHIPTQSCCLAHITTQLEALRQGAPVDLLFQSIAGTEAANRSFGITLAMLAEGRQEVLEARRLRPHVRWVGDNVMYFETGQGSALSAYAHHGIDQLTLEARAYGVAKAYAPFLVNSVVGFIGPEYLYDERQITRAGLEDHFMGKLIGLPMGCDVCYTNHAEADQNSADNLMLLLAAAGCNYFMGVPGADDVMLNYQSTSFHDAAAVRSLFSLQPAPEFRQWLKEHGVVDDGCTLADAPKSLALKRAMLERLKTAVRLPASFAEEKVR